MDYISKYKTGEQVDEQLDKATHTNRAVLDNITSDKVDTWDGKETIEGSQTKATKALNDSKEYVDKEIIKTKVYTDDKISEANSYTDNNKNEIVQYINTELAKKSNNHEHPYKPNNYIPSWNELTEKPTNVTTSKDGFMLKEDKTKLNSIENNANNYVHPNDTNTRHVTDSEKNTWNAKETTIGSQDKATKALNDAKTFTTEELKKKSDLTHSHGQYLTSSDIIDNLTNTSNNKALSANQGKILSTQIATVDSSSVKLTRFNDTLVELESNIINKLEKVENKVKEIDEVYENVEASYLNLSGTRNGYLENVEIKGNTVQNPTNLADIKSVGKKLDNQELYEIPLLCTNENLVNPDFINMYNKLNIKLKANTNYNFRYERKNTNTGLYFKILKTNGTLYSGKITSTDIFSSNAKIIAFDSNCEWYGENSIVSFDEDVSIVHIKKEENIEKLHIIESNEKEEYEPYKSNKITILSPCQIEKIGDIADRIIEKNGVLGVEKNVETITDFSNLRAYLHQEVYTNTYRVECYLDGKIGSYLNDSTDIISNKLPSINNYNVDKVGIFIAMGKDKFYTRLSKNDITVTPTNEVCLKYLKDNLTMIKLKSANPQFIPLPHDQQILLKTFDNKTNISFLTEIEGTIKAQVPKSIKATVNTHTSQIENIYDELDRVKKLEESTVSTVTTDKDFANVQATTNGYFEDVKLQGKTLVNKNLGKLNKYYSNGNVLIDDTNTTSYYMECEIGKEYTVIKSPSNRFLLGECDNISANSSVNPIFSIIDSTETIIKKIKATKKYLFLYVSNSNTEVDVLFLEGDYTQNPPSYFEGLKSVGDGEDEIVVSSVNNGNLFSGIWEDGGITTSTGSVASWANYIRTNDFVEVFSGCRYSCNVELNTTILNSFVYMYDKDKTFIKALSFPKETNFKFDIDNNVKYLKFAVNSTSISISNFMKFSLCLENEISYTSHKADKKRILYLDPTDNTWKKPTLREWDTIEKHSDGKYYYHQRSLEYVLNGSENFGIIQNPSESNYMRFYLVNTAPIGLSGSFKSISNIFKGGSSGTSTEECIGIDGNGKMVISILKSKLETQDIEGFKKWLQANNVIVVYQLAQEKVFECTNIDLITYANETNYVFAGGVISPRTSLKVQNNISNVVSTLQRKVSVLESYISEMFRAVLSGDMRSIAQTFYPEDFYAINKDNIYNNNETEVIEK